MPSVDFKAVRGVVALDEFLDLVGWTIHLEGTCRWRTSCPIKKHSRDAHRAVSLNTAEWYCHKCKEGGDVIDFAGAIGSLPLEKAAIQVCRVKGVPVPYVEREHARRRPRERRRGTVGGPGVEPLDPHSGKTLF